MPKSANEESMDNAGCNFEYLGIGELGSSGVIEVSVKDAVSPFTPEDGYGPVIDEVELSPECLCFVTRAPIGGGEIVTFL